MFDFLFFQLDILLGDIVRVVSGGEWIDVCSQKCVHLHMLVSNPRSLLDETLVVQRSVGLLGGGHILPLLKGNRPLLGVEDLVLCLRVQLLRALNTSPLVLKGQLFMRDRLALRLLFGLIRVEIGCRIFGELSHIICLD